ncbi:hypothetical protein ATCVCanal1_023L [Acanthocystis turfacea Chlorella virus Canal-1]|nr:hypothetical protein ATCVCanal1_023L [Acanthocystis turfacea Chlorella virus Canal-1]
MKAKKSDVARVKEMLELRKKFAELGLDEETEGMKELIQKMNEFVKEGTGFSGKIVLEEYKRVAVCKFTLQPHSVSTIVLKAL